MAKKRVNLSVDEDLIDKIKENDLNLSGLVNDFLIDFFDYEGESIHSINREIKKKELEVMSLLKEIDGLNSLRRSILPLTAEARKEKMWVDFRVEFFASRHESDFDELLRMDAEEVLGHDFYTLCLMCLFFKQRRGSFDCDIEDSDKWSIVEEEYCKDETFNVKYKEHHLRNFIRC